MTDLEIRQWLRRQGPSVLLVHLKYMYQVGVGESAVPTVGTRYLSAGRYIDESVPRAYDDCIAVDGIPTFIRSIDRATLRGQYRLQVGELQIPNGDGRHDSLLDLALDGSDFDVYIGDPEWAFSDFIHLYNASSLLAGAPSTSVLRLTLRDPGLLLNKRIGGTVAVGGTGPNANQFRPFNFGWVHQVEPILLDATVGGGQYAHSDTGTDTAAVAVRNDGVAVTFTDNADGTFTLAVPAAGNEKITCDVLATLSGGTSIGYRLSDLMEVVVGDRAGMTAAGRYLGALNNWIVERANDFPVGFSVTSASNVIELLDQILDTENGFWAFTRLGQFFYYGLVTGDMEGLIAGSGGAITLAADIVKDDVKEGSMVLAHNAPGHSSYQCYSNVNQFSQQTFASSLTEDERATYTRIGFPSTHFVGEDPGTTSYLGPIAGQGGAPELYNLTLSDAEIIKSIISGESDTAVPDAADGLSIDDYMAVFLALRRSLYLPWLEFVDITVGLEFYALELGDIVRLTYDRYGFDAGVMFQVCEVGINASAREVNLGLVRRRYSGVLGTEQASRELREDGGFELREDGGKELRD